jgi:hypothetical protein
VEKNKAHSLNLSEFWAWSSSHNNTFEYPKASQPSSAAVMLHSCGNSAPHSTLPLKLLRNWACPNLSIMNVMNRWYSSLHNLPPLAEDGTSPIFAKPISPNMSQLRWLQTQIQILLDDLRNCTKDSELRLYTDSLTLCQEKSLPQKYWKTPSRRWTLKVNLFMTYCVYLRGP